MRDRRGMYLDKMESGEELRIVEKGNPVIRITCMKNNLFLIQWKSFKLKDKVKKEGSKMILQCLNSKLSSMKSNAGWREKMKSRLQS